MGWIDTAWPLTDESPSSGGDIAAPGVPRAPSAGWTAAPIGSAPLDVHCSARRIVRSEDGLHYGSEENILFSVRERALPGLEPFWRLEVRSDPRDLPSPARRHWIVTAEWPYSSARVAHAPFKHGTHKPGQGRPEPGASAAALLDALPYDPWETGRFLVAGVASLRFAADDDRRHRHATANTRLVFGVCDDFGACVEALVNSRMARRLQQQTRVVRPQRRTGSATAPPSPFVVQSVDIHPAAHEFRTVALYLAVHQALAGPPPEFEKARGKCDVMDVVAHLFNDHMNNASKRALSIQRNERTLLQTLGLREAERIRDWSSGGKNHVD